MYRCYPWNMLHSASHPPFRYGNGDLPTPPCPSSSPSPTPYSLLFTNQSWTGKPPFPRSSIWNISRCDVFFFFVFCSLFNQFDNFLHFRFYVHIFNQMISFTCSIINKNNWMGRMNWNCKGCVLVDDSNGSYFAYPAVINVTMWTYFITDASSSPPLFQRWSFYGLLLDKSA